MFLPYRLLKKTLLSLGCSGAFMAYLRKRKKIDIARLREKFLKKCVQNDIIPRFLKFRVPENGCFVDSIVHAFQKKLLKTEFNTTAEIRSDSSLSTPFASFDLSVREDGSSRHEEADD